MSEIEAMKRCCWIHVGMHKTGTTSVQGTLMARKPTEEWHFLTLRGGANLGARMFAMFSTRPKRSILFKKAGLSAEEVTERGRVFRQELEEAILKTTARNVVISGESISNIDREGCRAMKEFLSRFFDEIRIVGYVRPPRGFKVSLFQELIKHGNGKKWLYPVGYRKRFRKFDTIFGRENVMLRKYDPAKLRDKCAVSDFCEFVGMPLPEPGEVKMLNERLCREACGLLYTYRQFGPQPERGVGSGAGGMKANKMLITALIAMKGTPFVVADSVLTDSLKEERKDIKWMEQRLGESLEDRSSRTGDEGIVNVKDLFQVSGEACRQFASCFREIHGLEIPDSVIPQGSLVEPAKVAEFVEFCRNLCLEGSQKTKKSNKPADQKSKPKAEKKEIERSEPEKVQPTTLWKRIRRKLKGTRSASTLIFAAGLAGLYRQ
jgi:hypothetical protein